MQYTFFGDTMYVGIITNNWKLIYTEDTQMYTKKHRCTEPNTESKLARTNASKIRSSIDGFQERIFI